MKPGTKLFLYIFALFVIQVQTATADYTADDVSTWKEWDWFKLVISVLGSLALSARMFFDQSVARAEQSKLTTLNVNLKDNPTNEKTSS